MSPVMPFMNDILYSGQLAYGEWGRRFEKSVSQFIGTKQKLVAVNSFSSAILVLLTTLGLKENDEIIASPQGCLASTLPMVSFGVKIIWADIDPMRGTLDPDSVRQKISAHTKLIMHNHHCGYPGYIDEINAIGKEKGIYVVDDCIEGFGAKYKGKFLGDTGADFTLFSFQTVRLPNTIDGGGILFKHKEHFDKANLVRDFGIDRRYFLNEKGEINKQNDVKIKGYGAKLNEVSSYVGLCQIKDLPELLELQKNNASFWHNFVQNTDDIFNLNTEHITPNYWVFGMLCDNKDKCIKEINNMGYSASGVHIPNTIYSIFGDSPSLHGVAEFHNKFVAVPSGWWAKL